MFSKYLLLPHNVSASLVLFPQTHHEGTEWIITAATNLILDLAVSILSSRYPDWDIQHFFGFGKIIEQTFTNVVIDSGNCCLLLITPLIEADFPVFIYFLFMNYLMTLSIVQTIMHQVIE
jgi:hypothetical protein